MSAKSLAKLVQHNDVWEVGMIHAEHRAADVDVVGLLVVVERATGAIRVAQPVFRGESPAVVLREAFVHPDTPARPGRPRRVVFEDPALQALVAPVLAEARVASSTALATPALHDAKARALAHAGGTSAPGIDTDLAAWRGAFAALIRVAPWTGIDDRVEFVFRGGALDDAVGFVSGTAGKVVGVGLYARRADLDAYRQAAAGGERLPMSSLHALLEPRTGLSNAEIERCQRVALQFVPGLYPRVYAVERGALRGATPSEQARLLTAVEGITALCERDLAPLGRGERAALTWSRGEASVEVTGQALPR